MGDWRDIPCKIWRGTRLKSGYGRVTWQGKPMLVHRIAWEQENGPVPDGLFVLHRCDNPPCFEVAHLYAGTQSDNMRDRFWKRQRGDTMQTKQKTLCEMLFAARMERKLTMADVERATGVDRGNLSRYERGLMVPGPLAMNKLATFYGFPSSRWKRVWADALAARALETSEV